MAEAVARSTLGGISYLAPAGSLAEEAVHAALSEAIDACIASRRLHLVLNLDRITLVNGRGIEIILEANARLSARGGKLQFANPSPLLKDIFIANGIIDANSASALGPNAVHSFGARPVPQQRKRLGEIAVEMKLVTEEQLSEAVRSRSGTSQRLGQWLVANTGLSELDLLRALSRQMGIPCVALRPGLYEPAAASLLYKEAARRLKVLPMFKVYDTLTLATADPLAIPVLDEVQEITGCKPRLVLALLEEITQCQFDAYSGNELTSELVENLPTDLQLVEQGATDFGAIDEMAAGSPVINLVNGLIQRAVRDGASDIHIEPARNRSMVRFRIDGLLYEVLTLRPDVHPALLSRLKVMANLDIAERRMPQDGRVQVVTQGRTVDLRFSSLPGIFGEKVVLRVLDKDQSILDVEKIGMSRPNLELFKNLLGRSY